MTEARHTDRNGTARLAKALADLASEAGARIVEIVAKDSTPRVKADGSPVTAADEAAEELIISGLARILPGVPVIAEEAVARGVRFPASSSFFLVDPIDGTKELVAGRSEYTVNIALVEDGRPTFGVIFAPRLNKLYAGARGLAWRQETVPGNAFDPARAAPIRARPRARHPVALISRSHHDPESEKFLSRNGVAEKIPLSSSLKFARLAEGAADLYARLAPISQWDIAAGHALLDAAGGSVTAPDGRPIRYGDDGRGYGVNGFVAWGAPANWC